MCMINVLRSKRDLPPAMQQVLNPLPCVSIHYAASATRLSPCQLQVQQAAPAWSRPVPFPSALLAAVHTTTWHRAASLSILHVCSLLHSLGARSYFVDLHDQLDRSSPKATSISTPSLHCISTPSLHCISTPSLQALLVRLVSPPPLLK